MHPVFRGAAHTDYQPGNSGIGDSLLLSTDSICRKAHLPANAIAGYPGTSYTVEASASTKEGPTTFFL